MFRSHNEASGDHTHGLPSFGFRIELAMGCVALLPYAMLPALRDGPK